MVKHEPQRFSPGLDALESQWSQWILRITDAMVCGNVHVTAQSHAVKGDTGDVVFVHGIHGFHSVGNHGFFGGFEWVLLCFFNGALINGF